jgi:hypothetical protein
MLDNDRQQRENDTFFSRATASVGEELGPQHKKMAKQQFVGSPSYQLSRLPAEHWSNIRPELLGPGEPLGWTEWTTPWNDPNNPSNWPTETPAEATSPYADAGVGAPPP